MPLAGDRERVRHHQRDRLRLLRSLCCAARLGSVTEAAERLLLDPRVVLLHLRELEHEVETPLLDRSAPGIVLTPAGEHLHQLALPLVEGMDGLAATFTAQLDDLASGVVHMVASPACALFVLPRFLERFRDQYPGLQVCVKVDALRNALPLLRTGKVEFAFGSEEPGVEGAVYRPLSHFKMVLITPEDHALAGREAVSWEEIAAWPVILPAPGAHSPQFLETLGSRLVHARVAVRTSGWSVIKRCVEAGIGIAVFPILGVAEGDRVEVVPIRKPVEEWSYGLLMPAGRPLSPEAERLVRVIDPSFPSGAVRDEPTAGGPAATGLRLRSDEDPDDERQGSPTFRMPERTETGFAHDEERP